MRIPLTIFVSLLFAASAAAQTAAPLRQNTQDQRQMLRQQVNERREAFKAEVAQKRETLQTHVKAERAELKEKLKTIRDEKKKAAVERIDAEITRLNGRMVEHFVAVLDKLTNLLIRIGSRVDKAVARGMDVSAVQTTITAARTAIGDARVAVSAQAGKTYAVNISTEANLKTDVGTTRQALRVDLKSVQEAVRAAREAVQKAATTLAQIPRVDEPTPTPVASPLPAPPPASPSQ